MEIFSVLDKGSEFTFPYNTFISFKHFTNTTNIKNILIYADLNVAQKFYQYNYLGIPDGYNAFATRGYADRLEYLEMEIQIAREISGKDNPNMMVYGGGEKIKELCIKNNVLYVEQFMANRVKKGGKHG